MNKQDLKKKIDEIKNGKPKSKCAFWCIMLTSAFWLVVINLLLNWL